MRYVALTLSTLLALSLGTLTAAAEWSVVDAPILMRNEVRNLLPERRQVEVMQRWIERLETSTAEGLQSALTRLHLEAIAVSEDDRERLEEIIPTGMRSRLQDSLVLEAAFLQEQTPEAISVFDHVARVANEVYALELDVLYSVPEWGGQDVRMMMETNIAVTDKDARFLGGRQESCFLIH